MPVTTTNTGMPPSGPYKVAIETDPGIKTHTIYRPMVGENKVPIVAWANGGCFKDGLSFAEFLTEIASHGFLIVADGTPNGSGGGDLTTDPGPQRAALDWATKENDRPCSQYYRKLDVTKTAAMGQSCGGLMTLGVSSDPRLTTIVIWNSGLFERDDMIYNGLHTPLAYFIGGDSDIAYPQAQTDFANITKNVPFFYGNLDVGHIATYFDDNGGEFGRVGVGWLKWQLMNDETDKGKLMFVGADCGLCKTKWVIKKKNME
jgi:hypothetical protein